MLDLLHVCEEIFVHIVLVEVVPLQFGQASVSLDKDVVRIDEILDG